MNNNKGMQNLDKKYKQLKQKQKAKISDYMYKETDLYFKEKGKMPSTEEEYRFVVDKVYNKIIRHGIKIAYDEIYKEYMKKRIHIEKRLEEKGIPEHIKLNKKIKIKNKQKKKKKKNKKMMNNYIDQDDNFFFIVGYTSGGAPYGVTWGEMGLEPWEELE